MTGTLFTSTGDSIALILAAASSIDRSEDRGQQAFTGADRLAEIQPGSAAEACAIPT